VVVVGDGGTDTVVLQDSGHADSASYTITSSSISRSGFGGLVYNVIDTVTLNGAAGGSSYAINSTAFKTQYTINAGSNADAFLFAGDPADDSAAVTLNGGAGVNT